MDCSLPGSSLHGILQARVLEWVAIAFSRGSSRPRDWIRVSCIPGRRFNLWATREALSPTSLGPKSFYCQISETQNWISDNIQLLSHRYHDIHVFSRGLPGGQGREASPWPGAATTGPLTVSLLPDHGNALKFTDTGLHGSTGYTISF